MATNWVSFVAGVSNTAGVEGRITPYEVVSCRAVTGPAPDIAPGSPLIRVESAMPPAPCGGLVFQGTVQHQNYTAASQRAELDSIGPIVDRAGLHCVLVVLHKTDAWYQLPADVRAGYFHRGGVHHQHAAVGAPYVKQIHRRLFHSRYCGGAEAPIPYDFVTYFEFPEAHRADFEELLAGLRDTERNPEWAYVDGEFEIWMRPA
ncbi:MAG: hypothetical protein JST93_33335 [Acidobacteria bacterium]|nr:hypothetical protein [Acidobacteriota bacterium]